MKAMLKVAVETPLGWVAAAATADGIWSATLPQPSESQAWDRLEEDVKRRILRPGSSRRGATAGDAGGAARHSNSEDGADGAARARAHLDAYSRAVADYSRGDWHSLAGVSLDLAGLPDFHVKVMQACCSIPAGETRTYAWLARAAGSPDACRAAGNAMARNPVPLLVPCHRVLRTGGGLGGFGGGLPQKRQLLAHEGWRNAED